MSPSKFGNHTDIILWFLNRLPLFCDLSDIFRANLSHRCQLKLYEKDQMVYSEGDIGTGIYIIIKGKIDAIWSGRDGREVIVQTYGPQDFLGLTEVADELPSAASCVCSSPSILVSIPPTDSRNLVELPELQHKLAKIARAQLHLCREGYRRIATCDLETRLALYLRDISKANPDARCVEIEESQLRIASKIRASRIRVNTTFRKWKRRGEISYSGGKFFFHESRSFWRKYHIEID